MYTLQGKTLPTRHTLSPRMVHDHTYLTWSTYSNLSYGRQQIWTDPLHPRRRAPDTTHSTTAVRSGPYLASLQQQPKSSGEKSTYVDNWLIGLPGPYISPHAIGTFNTCSRGPIERFLIDTGGGYNLRGADLPHTHSPTFPSSCPQFPIMAPPGLYFNQIFSQRPSVEVLKNLWLPCGLSTTRSSIIAYLYA
jgi:hypothetical protein